MKQKVTLREHAHDEAYIATCSVTGFVIVT